ncbi:hypothetical protein BsWGS_01029 [Bradybaena similaris]
MESQIPRHHVKQSVCATRPPYREGRQPKAVKVYTVNSESSYILIQGVPSVGATQELHKLCSTFGLVDKFSALDEYPTEDKYSEVYLVRYKKIQSARFAKRKLDDHSFFGGALHVCYAPEYESVIETREKLQERRRVIAAKIRQHENAERQPTLAAETNVSLQPVDDNLQKTSHRMLVVQEPNKQVVQQLTALESAMMISTSGKLGSLPETTVKVDNPANTVDRMPLQQPTFQLPLPPKPSQDVHKKVTRTLYEFSRVQSAHATLPVGYDARVPPPIVNQSPPLEYKPDIEINRNVSSGWQTKEQTSSKSASTSAMSNSGIVVKNYQPAKVPPRFVPRQALMTTEGKARSGTLICKQTDALDQDIRRNAFCLGETQGPAVVPQRKRTLATAAQQSVNETIMEIRSKISKVITQNVMKQNNLTGDNL